MLNRILHGLLSESHRMTQLSQLSFNEKRRRAVADRSEWPLACAGLRNFAVQLR